MTIFKAKNMSCFMHNVEIMLSILNSQLFYRVCDVRSGNEIALVLKLLFVSNVEHFGLSYGFVRNISTAYFALFATKHIAYVFISVLYPKISGLQAVTLLVNGY